MLIDLAEKIYGILGDCQFWCFMRVIGTIDFWDLADVLTSRFNEYKFGF